MKLIDLLKNSATAEPDRTAMNGRGVELTYERAASDVHELSSRLQSLGCSEGAVVAIVLDNSVEYLVSFFAISEAGATILPLSTRMTLWETARSMADAHASVLITNDSYSRRLMGVLGDDNRIAIVCVRYGTENRLLIESGRSPEWNTDATVSGIALMVPTSGTTGRPKLVMLTDESLISNMAAYCSVMKSGGHEVAYCALPLHHIYCICAQILTHVGAGDSLIIGTQPFFMRDFLQAAEVGRPTITAFVPYMAILLAEYPDPCEFDLSSLRHVTLSGAKTPGSTFQQLVQRFPWVEFINTYGMSEAGSRISIAAPSPRRFPPDSVGKPIPGVQVRIIDKNGNDTGPNQPGEILVKSSGVTKGYYGQPVLTAETLSGGWLKTADIGRFDEDGNLYILGRIKDTIITGGENVCPGEVEECLVQHPAIHEVAVVGRHHRLLQETPCAFVVKKNPSNGLTPADIIEFCNGKLSNHKIPRDTVFVDVLPRLESGKVDRSRLKELADASSPVAPGGGA